MSRSNPSEHLPNPATRWFEWNAKRGNVRYYDKDKKENVDVTLPFAFILLDELACVRGFHKPSKSGVYSNEVRDTTQEVMVVKAFKGGTIAEGKYKAIKGDVLKAGGKYNANCYVAFKNGDTYGIGSFRMKGAALGAWMDFRKKERNAIYKQAIKIAGSTEGENGSVTYRIPTFSLVNVSPEAEAMAVKLDRELQDFLAAYLRKNKRDQADAVAHHVSDEEMAEDMAAEATDYDHVPPVTDDDIPF